MAYPPRDFPSPSLTRRQLLQRSGMGFGALALGTLMAEGGMLANAAAPPSPLAPHPPQFAPRRSGSSTCS